MFSPTANTLDRSKEATLRTVTTNNADDYAAWLRKHPRTSQIQQQLRFFNEMVKQETMMPDPLILASFLRRLILPAHEGMEQYAKRMAHQALDAWENDLRHANRGKCFVP